MPISVLLGLIFGLTTILLFALRPLRVLGWREFIVSHLFMMVGLGIILGWIWMNRSQFLEATMIMGGLWTLSGGLCFVAVYALRRLKGK